MLVAYEYEADQRFSGASRGPAQLDQWAGGIEWGLRFTYPSTASSEEAMTAFADRLSKVSRKERVVVIGGCHSGSYSAVLAAHRRAGQKVGVLCFDAHLDAEPLGDFDGDSLYTNASMWRLLASKGAAVVRVVGVRSAATQYENDKVRISRTVGEALSDLADMPLYVSIDIDAFDTASTPATSWPVPGGLELQPVIDVVSALACSSRLVGGDIMEFNPAVAAGTHGVTEQSIWSLVNAFDAL